MEISISREVEALSETEAEDHHREKFPEKGMNIQTSAKVEQKKLEKFKNCSSVMSRVNEIEIVKKGPDHVSSLNKPSKPIEYSSKPLKVYFRPKTRLVNKLRLNMKSVLDPKFKKIKL